METVSIYLVFQAVITSTNASPVEPTAIQMLNVLILSVKKGFLDYTDASAIQVTTVLVKPASMTMNVLLEHIRVILLKAIVSMLRCRTVFFVNAKLDISGSFSHWLIKVLFDW